MGRRTDIPGGSGDFLERSGLVGGSLGERLAGGGNPFRGAEDLNGFLAEVGSQLPQLDTGPAHRQGHSSDYEHTQGDEEDSRPPVAAGGFARAPIRIREIGALLVRQEAGGLVDASHQRKHLAGNDLVGGVEVVGRGLGQVLAIQPGPLGHAVFHHVEGGEPARIGDEGPGLGDALLHLAAGGLEQALVLVLSIDGVAAGAGGSAMLFGMLQASESMGKLGFFGVIFHFLESRRNLPDQVHLAGRDIGGFIQQAAECADCVQRRITQRQNERADRQKAERQLSA